MSGEAWVAAVRSLLTDRRDATNPGAVHPFHGDPARMASYQAYFDGVAHQGRRDRAGADGSSGIWRKTCYSDSKSVRNLAFLKDLTILFDYNAAKWALCMMKVK